MGSQIDSFKKELANAKTKQEADTIYNKYRGALQSEDAGTDWEMITNLRKKQLTACDIRTNFEMLSKVADSFDKLNMKKFADCVDELINKLTKEI